MQATIYRFHRNERNVTKAECLMNKRALINEETVALKYRNLFNEAHEENNSKYSNGFKSYRSSSAFNKHTQSNEHIYE